MIYTSRGSCCPAERILSRIFFSALAQGLQSQFTAPDSIVTPEAWGQALTAALVKLYTYTRARPPSRTLVDPLAAFIDALSRDPAIDFDKAVKAADKAAEHTKDIDAKAGRSAYVEGNRLREHKIADPGAWGVKIILDNLIA